ncbi:gag-pol polyprotein [Lasallia pustulata]|uniref:Gag-pol polyprotein n=1 Tax=Lasallia pustulata TaxID=136370 RepID=A0A1W5CUM8_9LECA|nr:gag-pol polyprotein [Lasallia pustulata]
MDKLHSTLLSSEVNKKWWPEILQAVCYLCNRSPSSVINKSPYEAWFNEKPDLSDIRTLGSMAYALKPERKRRKLADTKAIKCVLLGYKDSQIYRLLTPFGSVIRTSNVHFQEKRAAINDGNQPIKRTVPTGGAPVAENNPAVGDAVPVPGEEIDISEPATAPPPTGNNPSMGNNPALHLDEGNNPIPFLGEPLPLQNSAEVGTNGNYIAGGMLDEDTIVVDSGANQAPNEDTIVVSSWPSLQNVLTNHKHLHVPDPATRRTRRSRGLWALFSQATPEPYEPKIYKEAINDTFWPLWEKSMKDKFDSLVANNTWKLVDPPPDRRVLPGKWEGLDYNETFATVVKPMSYKTLFAIAAALDLETEQMDVKTVFLYGNIDEEIYMAQPEGLSNSTKQVCRLNKALYRLKQSPQVWYNTLADYLRELGFEPLAADLSIFAKEHTFVAIYVNDLLLVGPSKPDIQAIKDCLNANFDMTDLGPCSYYLGMSVTQDRPNRTLCLGQRGYMEKVLRDFSMWESNPVDTSMAGNDLVKAPEGYQAPEDL